MPSELSSAGVPALSGADHVRGPRDAMVVIAYADFECPYCAAVEARLRAAPARVVFRHFPVRATHARALPAACAAEAAGAQGAFWPMHDALFADQGRLEDPHLWSRARDLGLDVARFDADRRAHGTRERVLADWRAGVRAGVVTTPTLILADGTWHAGRPTADLWARLGL